MLNRTGCITHIICDTAFGDWCLSGDVISERPQSFSAYKRANKWYPIRMYVHRLTLSLSRRLSIFFEPRLA